MKKSSSLCSKWNCSHVRSRHIFIRFELSEDTCYLLDNEKKRCICENRDVIFFAFWIFYQPSPYFGVICKINCRLYCLDDLTSKTMRTFLYDWIFIIFSSSFLERRFLLKYIIKTYKIIHVMVNTTEKPGIRNDASWLAKSIQVHLWRNR